MSRNLHTRQVLTTVCTLFLFGLNLNAQTKYDSLKIKKAKHYFQTVILLDGYTKPTKDLNDTTQLIGERLKTYGIKQGILYINTPLATFEHRTSDSMVSKNTHLLLTFNRMSLRPQFEGINDHELLKTSLGARIIVNPGKKGVWFFDISPFVTRDASDPKSKSYFRMANTFIYSHNKSERFNWRLGLTKSFLWGNRFYLPFVGFRFGKLDKTHFSIQFPRSMSLNMPINEYVQLSLYTKPQGGMWNFSNFDSLYTLKAESTVHFTRYEVNTGLRVDGRIQHWLDFYFAMGFSTKNKITFYSNNANNKNSKLPYSKYFYEKAPAATLFFNFGLIFKFGKTKSYYKNRNIYDAIDLNNTVGGGDDNVSNNNFQIPIESKRKAEDLKFKSLQDLIDYNDL
ncbi:MAG: hypothetical protein IPM51_03745 [Sphingobacteriaceae bacterium]|nr:hypothetical protein [Sphingobacteriaceae bacterium]